MFNEKLRESLQYLNLYQIGRTFHPSSENFTLPRYTIDTDNIVFPVGVKDKPIYRTFTLKNTAPNYSMVFDLKNMNNE